MITTDKPDCSNHFAAAMIRHQTNEARQVLEGVGILATACIGDRKEVLSLSGNPSDVAGTNVMWLGDMMAALKIKSIDGATLPDWMPATRPKTAEDAVAFLDTFRDTDTPEQALTRLEEVNTALATLLESRGFDNNQLVDVTFFGEMKIYQLVAKIIEHGMYHIGQAAGARRSIANGASYSLADGSLN